MDHTITRTNVTDAAAGYFLPKLLACEDFDRFEGIVQMDVRSIAAAAMCRCIESFDRLIRRHVPHSWSVHEVNTRTIVTLLGEVTYRRTVFLDEYGRRRTLTDELLGIPKRSRLSAGAFLWIVRHASEQSYRKTARAFGKTTGSTVSHITVMNCVRTEARLLAQAPPPPGSKISQDTLYLEVDGLWVHLQAEKHREKALPRFLYEQARKTASFELKIAAAYAGKRKVAPGRYERGGLVLTCCEGDADKFWERTLSVIEDTYELEDIDKLWLGADGGGWCGPGRIEVELPKTTDLSCSLDPFHIMQKIWRAFPEGPKRDWAVNLAIRRKAGQLVRMCEKAAPKIADSKRRKRVSELGSYMKNNADTVAFPRPSMGTMEGTNAHVGAARLKGQGRSWSRTGAEAMCLIRCALAMRRPLIPPRKDALFTDKEQKSVLMHGFRSASDVPTKTGSGYLPPHSANTTKMKTSAGFRACSC